MDEEHLIEKQNKFDVKLAHFEERQKHSEEWQKHAEQLITDVRTDVVKEIHNNVDGRMQDITNIVRGQQTTLDKIIEIQGRQSQQIETINNTLDHFTKIEERVMNIEKKQEIISARIEHLEEESFNQQDLAKERTKGRWSMACSLIAMISAVACALIAAFI